MRSGPYATLDTASLSFAQKEVDQLVQAERKAVLFILLHWLEDRIRSCRGLLDRRHNPAKNGESELAGLVGGEIEFHTERDALQLSGRPFGAQDAVVGMTGPQENVRGLVGDDIAQNPVGAIAFGAKLIHAVIEDI